MTTHRKTQKFIDEIMDEFDFKCVKDVMNFLKWGLYMNGKESIPTEPELRRYARNLIEDLIETVEYSVENFHYSQCGPFKVTIIKEGGFIQSIKLEFIVETWIAENDVE